MTLCYSPDTISAIGGGGPLKRLVADAPYRMAGRGVAGDFMWGTVDGWRRPRPEYFLTKKLYSPIFIEDKPFAIPFAGDPVVIPLENRNVFRNLNHYQCEWTLGKEHGVLRPDVPPMSSGSLKISLPASPRPEEELFLRFKNDKQETIDSYRIPFGPHPLPGWPRT